MIDCNITIDNGGTLTKIMLFNLNGELILKEQFETPIIEHPILKEIDLKIMWENIKKCLLKISNFSKNKYNIKTIICIGHGKGLYILGEKDKFIHNGILSSDRRAIDFLNKKNIKNLEKEINQEIIHVHQPVLLSWIKENKPDVYKNIKYIFSAKDFVKYMLSGVYSSDFTDLSSNLFLDLETKKYNHKIFNFFEIDEIKNKLPKINNFCDIAGNIRKDLANELGLDENIKIIEGMFDIDACALGSGINNDNIVSIVAGTWSINTIPSKKINTSNNKIWNSFFYNNEYFLLESSSPTSAGNINKIIPIIFKKYKNKDIFKFFEKSIKNTDILKSQIYYTPYLYGSDYKKNARSSFIGLTSNTKIEDLIRAIYEGIVYSHKLHIDNLKKIVKNKIKKIRISGGATNSDLFMQMFSDILNYEIETINCSEIGGLGGTIAANIALKNFNSIDEAIYKMVKIKNTFKPNQINNKKYDKKFNVYKKIIKYNDIWEDIIEMEELL